MPIAFADINRKKKTFSLKYTQLSDLHLADTKENYVIICFAVKLDL